MTGYLTTHVLDTARGCPAEGLKIELYRIEGDSRTLLKTLKTNDDGRTDEQILPAEKFATGTYELVFHAGAYLDAADQGLGVYELPVNRKQKEHWLAWRDLCRWLEPPGADTPDTTAAPAPAGDEEQPRAIVETSGRPPLPRPPSEPTAAETCIPAEPRIPSFLTKAPGSTSRH